MKNRRLILKSMVIALVAGPLLFTGAVPQLPFWNDGIGHAGLAQAAGKGGHSGHTTDHHDHDDSHTDSHVDDGHDSAAMAKKRHRHNGSKSPSGSTKGRGAGSQAVLEKIFERK